MQEEEIWKDLPEFKGFYQVSNFGRVRRLYKTSEERVIKNNISRVGYLYCHLSVNNKSYKRLVHRLVASAFLSLDYNNPREQVNHKDFNKKNNHVSNLEITSPRENSVHYRKTQKKNTTSSKIGVSYSKLRKKWIASISVGNNKYHLGIFKDESEARRIYEFYYNDEKNGGQELLKLRIEKLNRKKYKGVYFYRKCNKWYTAYKTNYIGVFETREEARMARQEWLINRGIPIYS